MRICYSSDFHGRATLYDQLADLVRAEKPALLILGGDMLPDGDDESLISPQIDFIHEDFIPRIEAWKNAAPGLVVACVLGNHEWSCAQVALQPYHDDGTITLLEHRQVWHMDGVNFLGYSKTPPTPHWSKDLERLDLPDSPLPKTIGMVWDPSTQSTREARPEEYFPKQPTIAAELATAATPDDPWIFVCHAPPYDTKLDRLPTVDHPIGSRAVRAFIEQRRPLCALHGHVHESPEFTGSHVDRVGRSLCINPGQDHHRLHAVLLDTSDPDGTLRHTVFAVASV